MKIQVLGSGCPTCKTLHKAVTEVVQKLGIPETVEYSTDIAEITKLGAMSSPVFAIDRKIISAGKMPTNEEIENALKNECFSTGEKNSCCGGEEKSSCCDEKASTRKEAGCCTWGSCETEKKSKCCILNVMKNFFVRFFKG